jgi:TolB protein
MERCWLRIAFTRRESRDGAPQIRIVPSLGGDTISVIPEAAMGVWSPNGRQLAYLRRSAGGNGDLVVANIDGFNDRVLMRADSRYPFLRDPAWSPDGREIAIVRGTGGIAGEIWMVPAEGGDGRPAMSDPAEVFSASPAYTSDGLALIHSSNRGGATNIWLYPLRGGAPVRLTTGPGPDVSPTVATDGTITFVNSRWRNALELHSLRGAPTQTLTSHAPYIWGPSSSPDEKEIAFSRGEVDGSWHIWTVPVGGGTPKRITDTASGEVYSRYGPDSSYVLFHTWASPRRIGRVPRNGGVARMLTYGSGSDAFPDVSPDGRWIAFTRTEEDAERLYVAPVEGGEPRLLTQSQGAVPRWSADGRTVVFAANRGFSGGIFTIDPDGRHERRLTPSGGWPVWWPDGKQIAYLIIGRRGDQEIHVISLDGSASRQLTSITFAGSNYPFDISRDGNSIVASNGVHVSDEIWSLEPRR